jgi:hypothetical protein
MPLAQVPQVLIPLHVCNRIILPMKIHKDHPDLYEECLWRHLGLDRDVLRRKDKSSL